MSKLQPIFTIDSFSESIYKEKSSLFIGNAFPIEKEDEAHLILADIKKKYYDATHHCYAYKLIESTIKYSDDGEPSGTAGIRLLNAIEHFQLYGVLVIVIRYFGGTKLGVGPLGKAYYHSAYITFENSKLTSKRPYNRVHISAGYTQISHVHRILSIYNAKLENSSFNDMPVFTCLIEPKDLRDIKFQLSELSKGNIIFKVEKDIIYL